MRSAGEGSGLLFATQAGVGWIVFDNPQRHNALTPPMAAALDRIGAELDTDDEVRCVVVRGSGTRAFMSGADIGRLGDFRSENTERAPDDVASGLRRISKPVIAMIHGWCLGGGLLMALAADVRIAAEDARFGIPAARLGIGYPLEAVRTLVRIVGPANAAQLLLTGAHITAGEALQMGLVNHVVEPENLERRTSEMATAIAANAPLSVRAAKSTIRAVAGGHHPQGDEEAEAKRLIAACLASEDFAEGRQAFVEKRAPRFSGR